MEDFFKYFNRLEICHLSPDSFKSTKGDTQTQNETGGLRLKIANKEKDCWVLKSLPGKWQIPISAYGSDPVLYNCNI